MVLDAGRQANVPLAFGLVCAAGAATGVGASAVFFTSLVKIASKKVLAAGLGFSGGIMLYVSFIEIFQKAVLAFEEVYQPNTAYIIATACFFGGVVFMKLIDWMVHKLVHDPHPPLTTADAESAPAVEISEIQMKLSDSLKTSEKLLSDTNAKNEDAPLQPEVSTIVVMEDAGQKEKENSLSDLSAKETLIGNKRLVKMGLSTAVAIGIHNFPEGLATFVGALDDPSVGISLAVAIAIHNVPEGLCVAVPIYYATGDRRKAFLWAMISGISEPIAAFFGWLVLANVMGSEVYGVLFGMVAGMMVVIVLHELLPTAHQYDPEDKVTTNSMLLGMFVMSLSLVLFMV